MTSEPMRTEHWTWQREELRRLAKAATPGPWYVSWGSDGATFGVRTKDESLVPSRRAITKAMGHRTDAAYIAAASPDVVLALLDALDAGPRSEEGLDADCLAEAFRRSGFSVAYDSDAISEIADLIAREYDRLRAPLRITEEPNRE